MRLLILLILCCASFAGCISNGILLKTYRKSHGFNGFAGGVNIDGAYKNGDSSGSHHLTEDIFPARGFNRKNKMSNDAIRSVNLKYDGKWQLSIEYTDSNGHTIAYSVKAKNKENYISLKRGFFLIPIPLLFFVEREQKTILFLDKAGHLTTVCGQKGMAWIILAAGGESYQARQYKQVETR